MCGIKKFLNLIKRNAPYVKLWSTFYDSEDILNALEHCSNQTELLNVHIVMNRATSHDLWYSK